MTSVFLIASVTLIFVGIVLKNGEDIGLFYASMIMSVACFCGAILSFAWGWMQ
jgi:membrane protein DedA with SNARE-associated domain